MESRGEKIQCLSCLSTEEPLIIDGKVICPDCSQNIQLFLNLTADEIAPRFEDSN